MPTRLQRYYGTRHLHFITCSCYHRRAWLGSARRRHLFLRVFEAARRRYDFVVGYVFGLDKMPNDAKQLVEDFCSLIKGFRSEGYEVDIEFKG